MSDGEKRLDTVRLQEMVQGFWRSGALMAAVELGLFTVVSKGAGTFFEVATALDITETNAERLMTACVTLKLLELGDEGRVINAPDVERFLVEGSPAMPDRGCCSRNRVGTIGECFQRNSSQSQSTGLGNTVSLLSKEPVSITKRHIASAWAPAADLRAMSILSNRKRMMDLGGGSGAYSIVATETYDGLRAVVLDLPSVAVVAREVMAEERSVGPGVGGSCDFLQPIHFRRIATLPLWRAICRSIAVTLSVRWFKNPLMRCCLAERCI